jgi:hypothetical protein
MELIQPEYILKLTRKEMLALDAALRRLEEYRVHHHNEPTGYDVNVQCTIAKLGHVIKGAIE